MRSTVSGCLDEDDILSFVTGELEAARRTDALAHVDECESCRMLAAELARSPIALTPSSRNPSSSKIAATSEETPTSAGRSSLIDGRFRLKKPLGRGAMGTVYQAHDEKLGIDVALKLLHAETDGDGPAARAFDRELRAGRRVTHPNVCRLHDAGHHEGASYITMELIDGETLAELLTREELTRPRALEILEGVAAGLAAAHAQGIVHRDLKPANVMIEKGTHRAVLTDFGFAADMETKQSRRLVGTPSFWAPEQARGEKATPSSDVYSLGLLAYRLLVGKEFSLSDERALDAVPRACRRFVRACLESRPGTRPQDANKAILLLHQPPRSQRWFLAVGGLTALVVGVFALSRGSITPAAITKATADPSGAPVTQQSALVATVSPIASFTSSSTAVLSQAEPGKTPLLAANSSRIEEKHGANATRPRGTHLQDGGAPSGPSEPSVATGAPNSANDPLYRH